ncbi:site-specific integrase [Listeria fleischmannii]|uniref:Tyrosine recombinase XerC n=1 Tax=Listeria fleischmannii FSL S10-1203 TaxID=1265822 RepID=W7DUY4_9LIST|nr:site-specific integrase [Listeria fleischmannii]EUJ59490.1 tyrosine recombinase XerC [Listeria fleischmannii FSL S10-1203]
MPTVRKIGSTYQVRWYYTDKITGEKKQSSKNGFSTIKEARNYGKNKETLNRQGKLYINQYTVESYLLEWIEHKRKRISKKSAENYLVAINKHIIPALGKKKLSELKKIDYQKFIYKELEQFSFRTVKLTHSVMSGALNNAVDNEIIERNITFNTDFSNTNKEKKKENQILHKKKELQVFLKSLDIPNNIYDIYFLLVANTGLRAGEALALKWGDINFVSKELNIDKTVKKVNGTTFEIGKPKTESSVRKINLDDYTLKKIEEWKNYQKQYILKKDWENQILFLYQRRIEKSHLITEPF